MRFSINLILLIVLFTQAGSVAAQPAETKKFQGFLGTYHPFKGTAYGGNGWAEGESLQTAFNFGANAIISHAAYNGYTFTENVQNNCHEWDTNKIYGILLPPTEKGVVNQPNDSDLMKPFRAAPGMIQGAHRFSKISKSCPQLSGVMIDDFFNDYPKLMTAENVRDIREALRGRTVDANGKIDYSSPATTPNLKLYIVAYEHQLNKTIDKAVLEAIDGINFWIWKQNENHKKFDSYVETFRRNYPDKEIITGVYIFNSKQTATPGSVYHLIERTIDLYAEGKVNGLLMFSAIWISREKIARERWNELALPQTLNRLYYPFLGEGSGRVVDAKTKKPIENALVTVSRFAAGSGKSLSVTRKFTDADGKYRFGGWAGKNKKERVNYEIKIEHNSFKPRIVNAKLRAGSNIRFGDARLKK